MSETSYSKPLAAVRLVLLYGFVVALLAFARPNPLAVTGGFLLAALGEALRLWAAGHLLKTEELVTSGPYRFTRNPLYLGRLLIYSGLCLMAWLPYGLSLVVLAAGYGIFFGYYLPRKERVEPARLRERHGESFSRYFEAVPALFPTLRPYPEGKAAGWSSDRMLRNREHWMVAGIVLISLFLLWRAYQPLPQEPPAAVTDPAVSAP